MVAVLAIKRQKDRQTDIYVYFNQMVAILTTDRQTDRKTDSSTDKQTDRHKDKKTETFTASKLNLGLINFCGLSGHAKFVQNSKINNFFSKTSKDAKFDKSQNF